MLSAESQKYLIIFLIFLISSSLGSVSTTIHFSDSNIPLELADPNIPNVYEEIMTGTKLSITIESDTAVEWDGILLLEGNSKGKGGLYGKGYDGVSYADSILPAAGDHSAVYVDNYFPNDPNGMQFFTALLTDNPPVQAGEWFIVDYNAVKASDCNITFYEFGSPLYDIQLKQVKTSDFDDSNSVDFDDFALLSSYWGEICVGPDWCGGADLDDSNFIDINDLYLFAEHWLDITR